MENVDVADLTRRRGDAESKAELAPDVAAEGGGQLGFLSVPPRSPRLRVPIVRASMFSMV
jgi:hypothetical protein